MSISSIYSNLKQKIYNTLKVSITNHSVLDCILHSVADLINTCYEEFEAAKDPHIYTNLTNKRIDGVGYLVNCPRRENEKDSNYLTRVMSWSTNNEAANTIAISNALSNLIYASNAEYVPFSQGTNTACVYIIPKSYDDITIANALTEVKMRLEDIVAADSYIIYSIPEMIGVVLSCYISIEEGQDVENIKAMITEQIKEYVNSIPIGEYLTYGKINQIGTNMKGVSFFNTANIIIDGQDMSALKRLQIIKTKFIFDRIYWSEVEN